MSYQDKSTSEDVKTLHKMGCPQEVSPTMGHFSHFAISFSIICILSGGINIRRFKGPPVSEADVATRQAAIVAAEVAVGEVPR